MHAMPSPKAHTPKRMSWTAKSCFSGEARMPTTSATTPIPKRDATIKKNNTRYSSGVGFLPGPVTMSEASANDLSQPQPPESQAPRKPGSSEFPAAAENRKDGGCWLQGAGQRTSALLGATTSPTSVVPGSQNLTTEERGMKIDWPFACSNST